MSQDPPTSVDPTSAAADDHPLIVLLVDDQEIIGEAIRRALFDVPGISFHYCPRAEDAVAAAQRMDATVILQDLVMPGMDGLALVRQYRANPATRDVPIIVLSSKEAAAVKRDAFAAGANDYLVKIPDKVELVARVRYHSRAYGILRQREELVERVRLRTAELAIANHKLEDSLAELQQTQRELLDASRRAGMADVATSVIHNLGNVLTCAGVAASVARQLAERSELDRLVRVIEMLRCHEADLGSFLTTDPVGRNFPEYLDKLAQALVGERVALIDELRSMEGHLGRIQTIVSMQQLHARPGGFVERVVLTEVVEEALVVSPGWDEPHRATVVRQLGTLPPLHVDRHKLLEILVSLLTNARQAFAEVALADRRIILRARSIDATSLAIDVEDNGDGIAAENIDRIFSLGFTTKHDSHGFGLHHSACLAAEMGGSLKVCSDGPGRGATFTLVLPIHPPAHGSSRVARS
jgi:C4-dicarboxylate-specific signal transduction histidine kinase